jgi:hypothetical protein
MSDENASSAAIVRMVRWAAMLQDAERLASPFSQDPMQAISRTLSMGDSRTAKQVLLRWKTRRLAEFDANPHATEKELDSLEATFWEMWGKIEGHLVVMGTEMGYYATNVAPDFGKHIHTFPTWATPQHLGKLFQEGHEFLIQGHMGTGKTHLAVLFMERLLAMKATPFVAVTNIAGTHDKTGEWTPRIHHVSLLSEILRIWCGLPEETKIFLVIDEPESNLRGGTSKGLQAYQDFRYMIRKLGITKAEIWHNMSEQYRGIREDDSEGVFRIMKDTQSSFDFTERRKGEKATTRIEQVPQLERLTFATRSIGSIDIDVSMKHIMRRISKLYVLADIKNAVREALEDPKVYLEDFQDDEDPERELAEQAKKAQAEGEDEAAIQRILQDPRPFMGRLENCFDRNLVQSTFGFTESRARRVALVAWRRYSIKFTAEEEAVLKAILERSQEFLTPGGRGFDRAKVRAAFNLSDRAARRLCREARHRRGAL